MTNRIEIRSAEPLLKAVDEFGLNTDSPEIKRVTSEICKQIQNFQEQLAEAAKVLVMLGTRLDEGYTPKMELVEVLHGVFNHVRGRLRQDSPEDGTDVAILLEFTRQFEYIRQGADEVPELFEAADSIVPVRGLADEGRWLESCRRTVESQDELLGVYRDLFAFVARQINEPGAWDKNTKLGRVSRITGAIQEGKLRKEERRRREEEERRRREEEERRRREEEERRRREEEERRRREEEERRRREEKELQEELEKRKSEEARGIPIPIPDASAANSVKEVRISEEITVPESLSMSVDRNSFSDARSRRTQRQGLPVKHEQSGRSGKCPTTNTTHLSTRSDSVKRTPLRTTVPKKNDSKSVSDEVHIPGWLYLIFALGALIGVFYVLRWCWGIAREVVLLGAQHWIGVSASFAILALVWMAIRWIRQRGDDSLGGQEDVDEVGDVDEEEDGD